MEWQCRIEIIKGWSIYADTEEEAKNETEDAMIYEMKRRGPEEIVEDMTKKLECKPFRPR